MQKDKEKKDILSVLLTNVDVSGAEVLTFFESRQANEKGLLSVCIKTHLNSTISLVVYLGITFPLIPWGLDRGWGFHQHVLVSRHSA